MPTFFLPSWMLQKITSVYISYMKEEPPGTNQQVTPRRRTCLGIPLITDFALLWLPGSTCIYSLLTSADKEIITSAMTPSNHQTWFILPFQNMRRGTPWDLKKSCLELLSPRWMLWSPGKKLCWATALSTVQKYCNWNSIFWMSTPVLP